MLVCFLSFFCTDFGSPLCLGFVHDEGGLGVCGYRFVLALSSALHGRLPGQLGKECIPSASGFFGTVLKSLFSCILALVHALSFVAQRDELLHERRRTCGRRVDGHMNLLCLDPE